MNDLGSCVVNGVATLSCIPTVLGNIIYWLFALIGIAAVIFVIYGGAKFVLSGGDPKQVEGARKTITYALIGLVIVVMSFAIINLVSYVTGVTCIKNFSLTNCQH